MPVTIYHNPRCNTSRKTLALLREKGVEPRDRRILEDALYGGAAEAASRTIKDAGEQVVAKKGGGRRRDRPVEAVGRTADRRDGQEPDPRRAADRRLGRQSRARPPTGGGAGGALAALSRAASQRCIRPRRTCRPGSIRQSGRPPVGSAASTASA